jgi:beta-glucan synthesis-associated protein KRE6
MLRYSAGYPLISHFISIKPSTLGGYNLGGINASGQVPVMSNHFALVDPDTPSSALYFNTYKDGSKWDLVFSDEFNTPNRSFYPVCSRVLPSRTIVLTNLGVG